MMNEMRENNACGRAGQLVGYLYGESDDAARANFEQHLPHCAACRDEVRAFGVVRESVGAWHAALVAGAPRVAHIARGGATTDAGPREAARVVIAPRRSALNALRELVALTPVWLRLGAVAAAVAVCALAALAIANAEARWENGTIAFRTGVRRAPANEIGSPQIVAPADAQSSRLERLVAERDAARRELEEARAQLDDSRAANIEAVYKEIDTQPVPGPQPPALGPTRPRAAGGGNPRRTRARRVAQGEEDLPRLLDLLGNGN